MFGKVMAGGLPGGALGGRRELMELLASTIEHPGTFNANPLTAAAGIATLDICATGAPQEAASETAMQLETEWREVMRAPRRRRAGVAAREHHPPAPRRPRARRRRWRGACARRASTSCTPARSARRCTPRRTSPPASPPSTARSAAPGSPRRDEDRARPGVQRRRVRGGDHAAGARPRAAGGEHARPARRPRRPLARLRGLRAELPHHRHHLGEPPRGLRRGPARRPAAAVPQPRPADVGGAAALLDLAVRALPGRRRRRSRTSRRRCSAARCC